MLLGLPTTVCFFAGQGGVGVVSRMAVVQRLMKTEQNKNTQKQKTPRNCYLDKSTS